MQLTISTIQPRIINSLDDLPEPEDMLCVYPTITLLQWALIMEAIVGDDLIEGTEE